MEANILYRARENPKHIMGAKKILGKSIIDSISINLVVVISDMNEIFVLRLI